MSGRWTNADRVRSITAGPLVPYRMPPRAGLWVRLLRALRGVLA